MCSQINHSFMRKRREALQFPSCLEPYSELHILPQGVAVSQGWCAPASATLLFPSPALPGGFQPDWALQPWLNRSLTPQSTQGVTPFLKQLTAVLRGACIQAKAAAGWGFWQELPTGARALVLCQCYWFKLTLPVKPYTWNTDTCPPGKSVKTRVLITQA